jgi:NhaA family Na+:H+ antiporter
MAIFFLLIGLELEREIYQGELSSLKNATFPFFAALGGMIVPAAIFTFFNYGTEFQSGTGIPTATDIAFAIGILALLGNKVPLSLKIFLTALAVIDDLGAIIVIALFYSKSLSLANLSIALGIFAVLIILNRSKVYNIVPYIIGGIGMWYFMHHSGIHATITGVLLAFAIPFSNGGKKSPSYKVQHALHKPVAFVILPLFAMANTGIAIGSDWASGLAGPNSLGIMAGLAVGKPIGILLFSLLGVAIGACSIPSDLKWKNILGAGFLGGIGFTMSIFITILAFDDPAIINSSKIAILVGSLLAGIVGYAFLKLTLKEEVADQEEE